MKMKKHYQFFLLQLWFSLLQVVHHGQRLLTAALSAVVQVLP